MDRAACAWRTSKVNIVVVAPRPQRGSDVQRVERTAQRLFRHPGRPVAGGSIDRDQSERVEVVEELPLRPPSLIRIEQTGEIAPHLDATVSSSCARANALG